ncbi:MAG TPA: biotin/lipoyl-containing protein [Pyrinomonadaceae bacterium]|nr:biotin/lipoyl-containing protein [Pyrinomonadaceae bacterium]
MKLKVHLSDREHDVSLTLNEGESAAAEVDGRRYEIEVREVGDGQYLILSGNRVSKVRVENRQGSHAATAVFDVTLGGHSYDATVIDPRRLRSGETAAAHGAGTARIISPMPGKVVRVLVEAGAQVEAGEGVVVVEAMKMQNEMKAPKAGVVVSMNAEVGATVSAGDVLAVIE